MINVMISGALGAMGKNVYEISKSYEDIKVVAGFDRETQKEPYPIYDSLNNINEKIAIKKVICFCFMLSPAIIISN